MNIDSSARRVAATVVAAACGVVFAQGADRPLLQPFDAPGEPPAPWHVAGLPDQKKPYTRFSVDDADGRRALRVDAERSYGNLVHLLPALADARTLEWAWRIDQPNPAADLTQRSGDDSPAKVCLLFDLPNDAVPFVDRQILRWARAHTHEPVPGATLCYVWDAKLPAGTLLPNAYTGQLRQIVLEGAGAPAGRWMSERRDVQADFLRAYADEVHAVPPLIGVAVGADADNTQAHSVAHVADLVLKR